LERVEGTMAAPDRVPTPQPTAVSRKLVSFPKLASGPEQHHVSVSGLSLSVSSVSLIVRLFDPLTFDAIGYQR